MTSRDLCQLRLENQRLVTRTAKAPADVVHALGAMQAQDYLGALWSVGTRSRGSTEAAIEQAIAQRAIVRTWPMRGTLHFVAASDVRWMLQLLTPRILDRHWEREKRDLGLSAPILSRCRRLLTRALHDEGSLTREEIYALLAREKISPERQRGYHILWRLAQEGLICCGARRGKQPTFVLLEDWIPPSRALKREAALGELARRYFGSHGPATLNDFAGWSGLAVTDARAALESVASELSSDTRVGSTCWFSRAAKKPTDPRTTFHLLPGFDEFLLGYKDRSAVLEPQHTSRVFPGSNGMFLPTILIDGRVAGTWKRTLKKNSVTVTAVPFRPLKKTERAAFNRAAESYGNFLGLPAEPSL